MTKETAGAGGAQLRVLLVGVPRSDREALAAQLAATPAKVHFLAAASPADAGPCLEAQPVDAIVCEWSAFPALRASLTGNSAEARPVPILVLVPPEAEAAAVALLEQEAAEFVLQAGDYPLWLLARLRRAVYGQDAAWQEVARLVRHELNNPLTGVLGNAELILAEGAALPERMRQRLATIIELTVRLRDVVRNLEERLRREQSAQPEPLSPAEPHPTSLGREVRR